MRYTLDSMLPEQAFSPRLGRGFGGGGMTLEGGKGGGGGQAPPSQQTVTNTSIPEYAAPYVQTMLGKTEALTDINQNPYQAYGGQRIAPFNANQEQAFQNTLNQQTAGQLGTGSAMAGLAGLGSLGAGADYRNMATNPNATAAYMSPYMQNVVDTQKDEAFRDAQIRNLGSNLGSARQGTYGGARQLLGEQERNRNLQQQLGNIQATGSQNAFNAAQQAQQFGTTAGLQGYGQAIQGASTLGQLGSTQFGQQQAINQGIQNVGNVQQAQAQQGLDLGYQDFLKQRNYPYQQLAFMSDMTRGIPLSQSSQQIYTAPPSATSQLGGLGMSALGIYGMSGGFRPGAKEGGLMSAAAYKEGGLTYAGGGDISSMSTEQLTEMLNNPSTDPMLAAEIEKLLMLHRRMAMNPQTDEIMAPALGRSGIASISTGDMVPEEMAGGGIIAFADRGMVNLKDQLSDDTKARRKLYEDRLVQSFNNMATNEAFKESKATEAETRAAITESKQMNPYAALTNAGFKMMKGSDDPSKRGNFLSELGEAGEAGLGTYAKGKANETDLAKQLSGQIEKREAGKYARDSIMHNALQSAVNQMDTKELGAINARITAGNTAATKESNLYLKSISLYKDTLDDVKTSMIQKDKFSRMYRDDPAAFNKAAEQEAKAILGPKFLESIGKTSAMTPNANPAAPVGKASAPVFVTIPAKDGKPAQQVQFASKEQADEFKKAAGLK